MCLKPHRAPSASRLALTSTWSDADSARHGMVGGMLLGGEGVGEGWMWVMMMMMRHDRLENR